MPTPDAPTFPIRPFNRPALSRLRYRLGAYPDILDAMLRQLNDTPELARWTHRASDDPGVALLESAAIVADILTFYQEHYANEAFLRTAQWRESVQELVRLTGYRLAPGVGGRGHFALEFKGTSPVTVPAGFPLKADLQDVADPVDFQTTEEFVGHPHLGKFRLYRERLASAGLAAGATAFEIHAVGGSEDPADLSAVDVKKGDKLMLVAPAPAWITSGSVSGSQQAAQTVKISKVTPGLGRIIVEIEGAIDLSWSGAVTAYRVNRTFRHFGHNTPPKTTYQSGSGSSMATHQVDAHLYRHIRSTACYGSPNHLYTKLHHRYLPLDTEVNDLSAGARIIVEALLSPGGSDSGPFEKTWLVHTIRALRSLTMSWGNVSGPSTWIDLGATTSLVPNSSLGSSTLDIRECRVHEVTGPALSLRRVSGAASGYLAAHDQLYYFGDYTAAVPLIGRRIYFQLPDGRTALHTAVAVDTAWPNYARMRRVSLEQPPQDLWQEDFDEIEPTVDVYGNVVGVTQGKAEAAVPLGNGDARQAFQTFKLPKSPLTYRLEPAATPPQVPELTVRVDGREWRRVDAFYGHGPLDEIYIVREDPKGFTFVQFGDGECGARLPSGINNVVAEYRTGSGALGPVKSGAKPSAGAKLENLEKVTLAGEVFEGAPLEDAGKARIAAPGKLQSLGRLVSLGDYEAEALQIGGVVTALAAWEVVDGAPLIHICVLLAQAQQSDDQFNAVESILRAADAARGPNRHALKVTQGELRYVHLTLTYAHDPVLTTSEVDARVRASLGLVDDAATEHSGLFGLRRRRLGEKEYLTRVAGIVQNVSGVVWCHVDQFGLLDHSDDPTALSAPRTDERLAQIPCARTELLQLHPLHLTLVATTP